MTKGGSLRFLAGAGSALLLAAAGIFIWTGHAQQESAPVPAAPAAVESANAGVGTETGSPAQPPTADERSREQRRFDRADRDNDGRITLAELIQPRHRAFARLDTNHDGRLSFEEWAVRTLTKFGTADANRDGALTRQEYATTASRRRAPAHQARCNCAQQPAGPGNDGDGDSN
jgi:hypothetical protein